MPHKSDFVCVASAALPSMKKDCVHHVNIVLWKLVNTAYCTCPARLSGYCNHVIAIPYCMEEYIHQGLQNEEKKVAQSVFKYGNNPDYEMLLDDLQM